MNCARCGTALVPALGDAPQRRRDDWTVQHDNALGIQFLTGYGMFDDQYNRSTREMTLVICHDCAHWLISNNPWITVVSNTHGHMHEGTDFGRLGHGHPIEKED